MLAPEGFLMSEWQLPASGRVLRAVLRVALVFAVVWASLQLIEFATQALSDAGKTPDPVIMEAAFWGMTALYALVLAIPFVPGVEIGLSMMMIRGADAALPVYLATIAGLTLAYLVGRYVRYPVLARWLSDFGWCGHRRGLKPLAVLRGDRNLTCCAPGCRGSCGGCWSIIAIWRLGCCSICPATRLSVVVAAFC